MTRSRRPLEQVRAYPCEGHESRNMSTSYGVMCYGFHPGGSSAKNFESNLVIQFLDGVDLINDWRSAGAFKVGVPRSWATGASHPVQSEAADWTTQTINLRCISWNSFNLEPRRGCIQRSWHTACSLAHKVNPNRAKSYCSRFARQGRCHQHRPEPPEK